VLRAIPLITRLEKPLFLQAGELLRQAVMLEPDYAAAHAWFAFWQMFLVGQGWSDRPLDVMAEAGRLAERAIMLDPQDAKALTIAGHVRAFLHHKMREALTLHDRALTMNPNLAMAWALSAMTVHVSRRLHRGRERFARYKQLSPLDPHAFFYDGVSIYTALLQRDFEGGGRGRADGDGDGDRPSRPRSSPTSPPSRSRPAAGKRVSARLTSIEPGIHPGLRASSAGLFERDEDLLRRGGRRPAPPRRARRAPLEQRSRRLARAAPWLRAPPRPQQRDEVVLEQRG
jgi:tetratricopeptide (TPR) repeat protein